MTQSTQTTLEAWRAYTSVGRLDAHLLRRPVFRAWERSHLAGANPRKARASVLSHADVDRLLSANLEFVDAAHPYLRALSRAAGSERHAAMLGDARAIILDVRGDDASVRGPERVPGPGSLLSEAHAGSNGIATSIVEGRYVEIVGPEHFIGGFHPFICQGVPIRDVHGQTVGSLSVSVRTAPTAARLRQALKIAARGIEADIVVGKLRARLRELQGRDDRDLDWVHLEHLHQDLVQLHTASRLEFELATLQLSTASDADALICSAWETVERFTRLSRLWRILAEPANSAVEELNEVERLDAELLVRDTLDLVRTEARLAGVTLRVATVPCGRIRGAHAAVRALMLGHWTALRHARADSVIELSSNEQGRVLWTLSCPEAPQRSMHYDMPVVRP